jgi:hypothetical protein
MGRRSRVWVGVVAVALLCGCASDGPVSRGWDGLKHYILDDGSSDDGAKLLTTDRLRVIARARGVGIGPSPFPFNRQVGNAFQEWALLAFPGGPLAENYQNIPSPRRERATRLRPEGPVFAVRPDAVGPAVTMVWERLLDVPRPRSVLAPRSVFVEVKAVKGPLLLSHSSYQITGLIDVAATAPAALMADAERPTPAVIFVTTGDTTIAPEVVLEATERRVAIWQTVAFELPGSTDINPRMGLGPVVPRNPEVYGTMWPELIPPGPPNVPFAGPRGALVPLVPGDPDPPEVR